MGRSAKKKINVNHTKRVVEFQTNNKIMDETSVEIAHHIIESYSKYVYLDPEKKALLMKATIESSNAAYVEKEDYLWRFFTLLEDNRAELEQVIAKKKPFSFNDRRVTVRNKSSEILVKSMIVDHPMLTTSSLMPDTFFSNLFTTAFMNQEPAFNLIFTLLNDKVYQIFNESTALVQTTFERLELELKNPEQLKAKVEANNNLDIEFVKEMLVKASGTVFKELIDFAKCLPGLNNLEQKDFVRITESRVVEFCTFVNSILYFEGEFYNFFDNLIYTKHWMSVIRSPITAEKCVEFWECYTTLNLSKRERALLSAQILTQQGKLTANNL
jgi:hypothetical protein